MYMLVSLLENGASIKTVENCFMSIHKMKLERLREAHITIYEARDLKILLNME